MERRRRPTARGAPCCSARHGNVSREAEARGEAVRARQPRDPQHTSPQQPRGNPAPHCSSPPHPVRYHRHHHRALAHHALIAPSPSAPPRARVPHKHGGGGGVSVHLSRHTHAPAPPRARVPHEHDGGGGRVSVPAAPALAQVGTARLLAHSGQLELAQLGLRAAGNKGRVRKGVTGK